MMKFLLICAMALLPLLGAAQPQPAQSLPSEATPALSELQPAEVAMANVAPVDVPADLWVRIRRGYAMPDLDDNYTRKRELYYSKKPDYMNRMSERGAKYLFHIVESLEQRGMPTELALLPFVESAFVVSATSRVRAEGMWQFMPGTGKDFNLKQNLFRDDRRDVQQSTRAALDYLQKLHGMFGDWHLALAAYNWGQGNVGRAIERNKKAGLGTGYLDLKMPDETRDYVPKLQAIKNIVSEPARFNITLPVVDNHPFFQTVELQRDIDVALAARLADVRVADFVALNPSANKPVILAAGTPQILLPWDNAEVFLRNLAAHTGALASWTAWSVPSQMKPAEAAKRVGMSEAQLREVNRIPPNHSIRAGSTLLVPRSASAADVAARTADTAQLSLAADMRKACRTVKGKTVCRMVAVGAKGGVKAKAAAGTKAKRGQAKGAASKKKGKSGAKAKRR